MTAHRATPMTGFEANCLAAADHFIACRGSKPATPIREAFVTLALAESARAGSIVPSARVVIRPVAIAFRTAASETPRCAA